MYRNYLHKEFIDAALFIRINRVPADRLSYRFSYEIVGSALPFEVVSILCAVDLSRACRGSTYALVICTLFLHPPLMRLTVN